MWSAYRQLQALEQNLTIATNYYNENHKDFAFWLAVYQGTMSSALTEAMSRHFYTDGTFTSQYGQLDYLSNTGRGQSRASLRIDREWQGARRRIGKYNVGLGKRIDYKYAVAKLNSELEGWNLGYRYEDHRKMVYDDQRHAHQAEILNLGIGATNAARGRARNIGCCIERSESSEGWAVRRVIEWVIDVCGLSATDAGHETEIKYLIYQYSERWN